MFRKVLASLFFAGTIAVATSLPVTAFAATIGDPVLEYGSQGPEVKELQAQLQNLGYFPESVSPTDYFGTITKQAVLSFKKDYNLTDAEKVGNTTESEILKALSTQQASMSKTDKLRNKIINVAKQLTGTPYAWGGISPSGFDCSGFTKYVFSQVGISLPRTSEDQFNSGNAVDKSSLKPGDLVFFHTYDSGPSHVGIYIGNGEFIHSASVKVQIDSISDPYYWGSRFIGAKTDL